LAHKGLKGKVPADAIEDDDEEQEKPKGQGKKEA